MSWQYESLSHTSVLPGQISEEKLQKNWAVITAGTHGEEEEPIEHIRSLMDLDYESFLPGVIPIIANRLAAEQRKRYIHKPQLMACYPGDFDSDHNEKRTAAGITWLIEQLNPQRIVIDRHESLCGSHFMEIGSRTTPAALAAGWLLGHTDVWISRWSTFCNTDPSILITEEPGHRQEERQGYFAKTNAALQRIAELGHAGLTELFFDKSVLQKLRYFKFATEPLLTDPEDYKKPNPEVIAILEELETLNTNDGRMSAIYLSDKAQMVLNLPPREHYYAVGGNYMNRSAVIANDVLDMPDDRVRRLCWGAVLHKSRPPRLTKDGDMLIAA